MVKTSETAELPKKYNLYQKINEVKKVIKTFQKDAQTEGYGSYKFISGTQILSSIKDKMEELQLLLLPIATKHQHHETYTYNTRSGPKTDFVVIGEIVYEWVNAENPEERQRVEWQYYGQQGDISKAFGSGLTYSERYVLLKSLGAPTDDEDPDAKSVERVVVKNQTIPTQSVNDTKYKRAEKLAKANGYSMETVKEWVRKKYKKAIPINSLSNDQFDELMSALNNHSNE